MQFKKMTDLDLRGKRVFIRADLNVPQADDLSITDDTRIRASVPAIKFALDAGAAVMVTSHLGRPTEGEHTIGELVDRARKRGIATPILTAARCNLQAYEGSRVADAKSA